MEFCLKLTVKLLLSGLENDGTKNMVTSPLSYNAIMNMLAAGTSCKTLDQILHVLQHNHIDEVNFESSQFAEIASEQPRKTCKRKIDDVEIENGSLEGIDENNDHGSFVNQSSNHYVVSNEYNRFSINIGKSPSISLLNGIWVNQDYRLKDSFHELMENVYKAKVRSVDYRKPESVIQETNEWASASTNGLIKELLGKDDIKEDTILILGNALYFKGSWEKPLCEYSTTCKSFYLLNGEEIMAPFMTDCTMYSNQSFQDFQVARIPYSVGGDVHRKFAMYLFLPNEKDELQDLLTDVESNPKFFKQYCNFLEDKADIIWIPKFKFSYITQEGPKIMKGMGLDRPFDMDNAELNEMVKDEDLPKGQGIYVSKIIQKAFIEVDEEGTEAVALTYEPSSPEYNAPTTTTKFIADHPFIFIIMEEKSGILFFVGTVLNPLEA